MLNQDIFNKKTVYTILNKREEIQKTYLVLSKIMEQAGMEAYTEIAANRIFEDDCIEYAIRNDHVVMDLFKHDLWLDEVGLHWFSSIMEGYVDSKIYEGYLESVECKESIRRTNNLLLKTYQKMSSFGILKTMFSHMKKYRKSYPDEVYILSCWCCLELISRTFIPRLYYFIKELPERTKNRFLFRRLEMHLRNVFSLE